MSHDYSVNKVVLALGILLCGEQRHLVQACQAGSICAVPVIFTNPPSAKTKNLVICVVLAAFGSLKLCILAAASSLSPISDMSTETLIQCLWNVFYLMCFIVIGFFFVGVWQHCN